MCGLNILGTSIKTNTVHGSHNLLCCDTNNDVFFISLLPLLHLYLNSLDYKSIRTYDCIHLLHKSECSILTPGN